MRPIRQVTLPRDSSQRCDAFVVRTELERSARTAAHLRPTLLPGDVAKTIDLSKTAYFHAARRPADNQVHGLLIK